MRAITDLHSVESIAVKDVRSVSASGHSAQLMEQIVLVLIQDVKKVVSVQKDLEHRSDRITLSVEITDSHMVSVRVTMLVDMASVHRAAIVQDIIMMQKVITTVSKDSVRVIMQRERMHLSKKALTAVATASRAAIIVAAIISSVVVMVSRVVLIVVVMVSRAAITVVVMVSSVAHMASRAAISAVSIHRATILTQSIVTRSELNIVRQI